MRSSLELFLLSLVRDGLGTPYDLKARADLSLGSTVPALARLAVDGLLKGSEIQSRRSRKFTITSKGLKALQSEWSEHLKTSPTDIDSVLRIAYLAWQNGKPTQAAEFLRNAADRLHGLAAVAEAETVRFGKRRGPINFEAMRWLRAQVDALRIEGEVKALASIGRVLTKCQVDAKKQETRRRKTGS